MLGTAGSTGLRGQKAGVFLLTLADPKDPGEPVQTMVLLKLNPELDFQTGASFAGLLTLWVFLVILVNSFFLFVLSEAQTLFIK